MSHTVVFSILASMVNRPSRCVVFIHVPGAGGAFFVEEFDDHHKNITFHLPKELNEKVAKYSLRLVRAMVLRHCAIADPSLTVVSRHFPT